MYLSLWKEFFYSAVNPVFFNGQTYVDLAVFDQERYKALALLKDLSTLEILLLGELIIASDHYELEDQLCSEHYLFELFENYDCNRKEISDALIRLKDKNWAEFYFDADDGCLFYRALIPQLHADGIYTHNKWKKLHLLGLYGDKLGLN